MEGYEAYEDPSEANPGRLGGAIPQENSISILAREVIQYVKSINWQISCYSKSGDC
jgi:hypothetical protein